MSGLGQLLLQMRKQAGMHTGPLARFNGGGYEDRQTMIRNETRSVRRSHRHRGRPVRTYQA